MPTNPEVVYVGTGETNNYSLGMELLRRGVSAIGAQQLLTGEIITGLKDRAKIHSMIHAEKNQDIILRGGRTETVDMNETITVHSNRTEATGWAGLTLTGVWQLKRGQPVTDAIDRRLLATAVATILS